MGLCIEAEEKPIEVFKFLIEVVSLFIEVFSLGKVKFAIPNPNRFLGKLKFYTPNSN
jgi:hypothetical protein